MLRSNVDSRPNVGNTFSVGILPRACKPMHSLIASLSVASVLAHALLGCCWHAAHIGEDHMHAAGAEGHDVQADPHSQGHLHHYTDKTPCPDESDPSRNCRHSRCQWMASGYSLDLNFGTFLNDICTVGVDVSLQQHHVSLTQSGTNSAILWRPALPVRSHLAINVLLI